MTETWLLALANTGGDFPVAEILPFTTHRDGGVRGAAMLALGRSTTEAALQALGVALRTDVDPTVRGCAAEALARQASETATTELERGLNSEPVRDVRLTAIDELSVRARRWPGAARLLRWLADHDPDQDVRAAARDALARS